MADGHTMTTTADGHPMPTVSDGRNMPTVSDIHTMPTASDGHMATVSDGHMPTVSDGHNMPVVSDGHTMPISDVNTIPTVADGHMTTVSDGHMTTTMSTVSVVNTMPTVSDVHAVTDEHMPTGPDGQALVAVPDAHAMMFTLADGPTVADIVTGILVTELAADDDMNHLVVTNGRNLVIRRYLQQRQRQKKRMLLQMAHACIRKKRVLVTGGSAGAARRPRRKRKDKDDNNCDHDYLDNTVPWFCDDEFTEFRNHFNIERATFDKIVAYSSPKLGHQDKCTLPIERKILVAMWLLSSQESFRNIGEKFGLQKSTTYYAFVQFVGALSAAAREFIYWPDAPTLKLTAAEFERHFGLPGVVGAVHSCQIPVKIAPADATDLADIGLVAEPYATMTLQAVCDSRLKFLDVHVGVPQPTIAVVCNWRFLEASDLGRDLAAGDGPCELPPGTHLVADASYPLRPYLLTPYSQEVVDQSEAARHFNAGHHASHHVVHRCLGLLRRRFSRLKYVDTLREDLVPQIVMAACVLHNMIVEDEDCSPDGVDAATGEHDFGEEEHGRACSVPEHHLDDEVSLARRDEIANRLVI